MIQLKKETIDITSHDLLTLGKYKNYGPKINHVITLNSTVNDDKCIEYSEKPEMLKELLKKLIIKVHLIGPIYSKWNDNDKDLLSMEMLVTIKRVKGAEISFSYYGSHNDAMLFIELSRCNKLKLEKHFKITDYSGYGIKLNKHMTRERFRFLRDLKYSILACCSMDYYIDIDFDEFCSNFGYDNDSMKANEIHKQCLKQSAKLQCVFNENEAEVLPC